MAVNNFWQSDGRLWERVWSINGILTASSCHCFFVTVESFTWQVRTCGGPGQIPIDASKSPCSTHRAINNRASTPSGPSFFTKGHSHDSSLILSVQPSISIDSSANKIKSGGVYCSKLRFKNFRRARPKHNGPVNSPDDQIGLVEPSMFARC